MRCCATCRGHRSLHWHRSRFPANGAAPRGGRRLSIMGWAGRDGFAGDAVNPSVEAWPRHPCRGHPRKPIPPGHGQFPCASTTEKKEKIKSESGSGSLRSASTHGVDLPCRPRSTPTNSRGNLSGVGRCGAAGPLAPWMAPSSPQGRVYGVSCSPTPPRPTITNPELLLLLLLPLQVQGCKPCKATTSPSLQSPAGRGSPATAAASATPGSSHPAGPATAATPATAPPRCNRAHPRAARH